MRAPDNSADGAIMDTQTQNYASEQVTEPPVVPADALEPLSDDEAWDYDAFISYRRVDGESFAAWLRAKLEAHRLPKNWPNRHRSLKIYLDKPFERASDDFWQENIEPALARSRYLIVVVTPAAYQPRGGGQLNWVEREIDFFTKLKQGRNVLVALISGDFDAPLPGGLREKFPQITVVDMRAFRTGVSGLARRRLLHDHVLTLLASLYKIPDTQMPAFRQEEERRRRKRMMTVVMTLSLLAMLSLGGYVARALYVRTVSYQLTRLIGEAPGIKTDLGDDGTRAWADALALAGRTDEALAYARGIVQEDERAAALAAVAERVTRRGEPTRGQVILNEALGPAQNSPPNRAMQVYRNIIDAARALIKSGKSDLALRILDAISRESLQRAGRDNTQYIIANILAVAYVEADNKEAARQTWLAVVPVATRDKRNSWEMTNLAIKLSEVGEQKTAMDLLAQAEQRAKEAERGDESGLFSAPELYLLIANAYRTLRMPDRQQALTEAAIRTAAGMKGQALEVDDNEYVRYFEFPHDAENFARWLTNNGRHEAVGQFVQREEEPLTRVAMLLAVADALADKDADKAGQYLNEAEQQAQRIEEDTSRAQALTDVAASATRLGDKNRGSRLLDEALGAARKLPENYVSKERDDNSAAKTERLAAIALELGKLGRTSDADKVAHEAEQVSRHITGDASYYLPRLCEALASVGDHVLARQTAERGTGNDELNAFAVVVREITRKLDGEVERLLREDEEKWKRVSED